MEWTVDELNPPDVVLPTDCEQVTEPIVVVDYVNGEVRSLPPQKLLEP